MLFRLPPAMGPAAYKTYGWSRPIATHWRKGTCAEAGCRAYYNGWKTVVDESTDLGAGQANYIRHDKTRKCTEARTPEGLTEFSYPAGQRCFRASDHLVRLEREASFYVRGGDYRGNPLGTRTYVLTATQWEDDFSEHQDRLAEIIKRG